jgi:outer membrane receptor protein involved in Fe transport
MAVAQDDVDDIEEITVTGSRIRRADYQAASPVVSLDSEVFKQSGTINAEELVNTLPQVVPSFSSGNNNPGNGQSWINLRGLGSGRNLVLVDGSRMVPANEDGIVDINSIPVAMLDRVEILSGGASAVYGSDAIAGATNFILKDDFEGVDMTAQTGMSAESDTEHHNFELVLGSNFADGRGNATMWGTYNKRERLGKGERAFSAQAVSPTSFFPSGHVRRALGNSWTLASVQDVFTNMYGAAAPSTLGTLVGNDDGTLFTQGGAGEGIINFREVIGEDIDGLFVAQNFRNGSVATDTYSYNFEPWNNLVLPQERVNLGTNMRLQANERMEMYGRVMFTNYSSSTQLAPSPAPTSRNITNPAAAFEFTVPATNPFVVANAGLSQILASRTGDNVGLPGAGPTEDFIYRRRFIENGPRIENYERDVYQGLIGTRGDITDRWNYDVYFSHGKYNEQLIQNGNVSTTRVESLLDAPDGGVSICAGGLNPVGANTLSPECAAYVGAAAKNNTQVEANNAEAVVSGELFSMPAGEASVAVGFAWSEMSFAFIADELLRTGDVSGFNAQDNILGRVDNNDVFVEFYLPILSDRTGFEHLGLTLGYRYTDHNLAGSFDSYKAEVDWGINDSLRVRGSFQQAVRAPNIGELFSPQNEDNPMVTDPCNFDSSFRTGSSAAQVESLCIAQGIPASAIGTYKQSTGQISALAGGNPNLENESADTYTLGFVWQPDFANLQVSLDYYNIEVSDVITDIDPSTLVQRCFNSNGFNPNFELNNEWCNFFGRSGTTGEIIDLLETQQNIGGLRTDGVDFQLDWSVDAGASSLTFNFISTYVLEWAEQILPGDQWFDYDGTIGDDVAEALPDFKFTFNTIWDIANFSTALRLRYLPDMDHEEGVQINDWDPDVCDCSGVSSVVYADISTRWQATDAMSVRLGIDNLTDEKCMTWLASAIT